MTKIERPEDKARATAKPAEPGAEARSGDRDMAERETSPPQPAEQPLDDDGNDARNIGG